MMQAKLLSKPKLLGFMALILPFLFINACNDDDFENPREGAMVTGKVKQYRLEEVAGSKVSGTVSFMEKSNNSAAIIIRLSGTQAGASHPAHIHLNTAAEGGDIVLDLNNVQGGTGYSETEVTKLNDGSAISYAQLIDFNGYVNVHLSASNLASLVAQGDIGKNELSTTSKTYTLDSLGANGLKGTAKFTKRVNGNTLVTLKIEKTAAGAQYPTHIHANSAAEGGGIIKDLTNVDGTTGISATEIKTLNNGTAITYDQLMNYNGYINVHKSANELANVISQGDIGGNELIGTNKTYTLVTRAVPGINGTARFDKRKNGNTLVSLDLKGTPAGGSHPAHIHFNSALEGGGIAISLKNVDGTTGKSRTTVIKSDGATGLAVTYDSLMKFDGYVNVHLSADQLSTIVAQGDIGGNELTGNKKEYTLNPVPNFNIAGTAKFEERMNGNTLVTLTLPTSPGMHPAHIHANSAAEGGGIVISLNDVDGNTGMSMTNVRKFDDKNGVVGAAIKYAALLNYDGYINIHESMANLATLLAQGDIGGNELTGTSKVYPLSQKDVPGIYGNAKFEQRKNGNTLITISLVGTPPGGSHPAHIHQNSATETGPIVISLQNVNGTTGKSITTVKKLDGATGAAIKYTDLLTYDGYLNVHLSPDALATLVAQGNVGSNAP